MQLARVQNCVAHLRRCMWPSMAQPTITWACQACLWSQCSSGACHRMWTLPCKLATLAHRRTSLPWPPCPHASLCPEQHTRLPKLPRKRRTPPQHGGIKVLQTSVSAAASVFPRLLAWLMLVACGGPLSAMQGNPWRLQNGGAMPSPLCWKSFTAASHWSAWH